MTIEDALRRLGWNDELIEGFIDERVHSMETLDSSIPLDDSVQLTSLSIDVSEPSILSGAEIHFGYSGSTRSN